jgi:iron complex transport system substrate-binding protein
VRFAARIMVLLGRALRLTSCIASALWLTGALADEPLPRVASLNLCADQLLLNVADPRQIAALSWLARDPEESVLAERARYFPINYGSAEEILKIAPDVVIAGAYTSRFARAVLESLGYLVVEIAPAVSLADIEHNLRVVGRAIGRAERAREVIVAFRARAAAIRERHVRTELAAVVVRPGGYTTGSDSLGNTILELTGLRNVAARHGLDRWGSLSMEALLLAEPDLLILTDYRARAASLANAALEHPALRGKLAQLTAVRVPSRYWSCGLPQSLESADLILDALSRNAAVGRRSTAD